MGIQNNLVITLSQLDSSGVAEERRIANFSDSAVATVGDLRGAGVLPTTGSTSIALPIAQTRQLYFKNTHATAKITVVWTPNGGASATIGVFGPGEGIIFWCVAAPASAGISALALTSDTIGGTYELFLGG